MLPSVTDQVVAQGEDGDVVVDENTTLIIDDTTSWEALDVHNHISGAEIGNITKKIDLVKNFAENEKIKLNPIMCNEMTIEFRKDRTVIPAIKINYCVLERVSSYKLLGLWIDELILSGKQTLNIFLKNAAKRLHILKNH